MSNDTILALIFTLIIALAAVFKFGFKKQRAAKVTLGVGALLLSAVSYLLQNTAVPVWILGLSGILLLADAWYGGRKFR